MPERGVLRVTTSNGIPIGCPLYRPEPKSGWRPTPLPIDAISGAEFVATGSESTRWFHALSAGKIGQRGADGSRSAFAEAPPNASMAIEMRARRITAAAAPLEGIGL